MLPSPAEEFSVTLEDRENGTWRSDEFFRTGGTFSFQELPAGTYKVAVAAGAGNGELEVPLADGETKGGVEISLQATATVRGTVIDGSFPSVALLGQSFLNRLNLRRDGILMELSER